MFDLDLVGAGLPVAGSLDELRAALASPGSAAVVQAPPGTGKTTLLPPLLANLCDGRVVVTQPRRIAARAAARRLAQLTGTRLGHEVGFTVRGESRTSRATRVEFVTTGVMLRRLLADPELPATSAVVLDEVHERHLDADLTFALLREVRELRDDLTLVAMSATLDADRWATLLGDDSPAQVVRVASALHPLQVVWDAPSGSRTDHRGVTHDFLDHLAAATRRALESLPGKGLPTDSRVLVFVPGAWEADQVAARLLSQGLDAAALHGRLDAREQDRVLAPDGPQVVVSTAVAESSVTVARVRVVVDAGLSREPRYDQGRGMAGLVTVSEARSSAEQRAGRAARLGPGLVVRCFPERDWVRLRPFTTPEIATADLTSFALDVACWGAPGGRGLALPDAPPAAALDAAIATLQGIGALDADGRATALGRQVARVPADPRLARALLVGAPMVGARAAAEVVSLLAGDDRPPGGDLAAQLRDLRAGRGASRAWRHEADRLEALVTAPSATDSPHAQQVPADQRLGLVVALAHPDRIARRRGTGYLTTGGTGLALERGSRLQGEWLAVAEMSRAHTGDGIGAVVRAAVPITREVAELAAAPLRADRLDVTFDGRRVVARQGSFLGAVELSSTPVQPPLEAAREAVLAALRDTGLGGEAIDDSGEVTAGLVAWEDDALALRRRLALLHHHLGNPWPAMDSASLLARADEWLAPELDQLAQGVPAARIQLAPALRRLLAWPLPSQLDHLAPERLAVPTGSRIRLDYPAMPDGRVVLAVKLQECFGLTATPTIVEGKVPVLMHLLSPAGRPLAVTDDLASFWTNAYPGVRAENRGRYSKHPWPEDPLTAVAKRGTSRSGV